ncbi:MAG: helix-turn-helix protein [Thermomicrobiales bacterium]|jgi:transcriptional regulator with XRE-family HTH domain|nr:helix-turn-helix protein [Thermomicrobiales bacterium]
MRSGLGGLVIERRRELGLTQQELARRIGVPTANLSQLEHSTSRWQSRLLWALADELRLPQLELVLAARVIADLPPLDAASVLGRGAIEDLISAFLADPDAGNSGGGRSHLSGLVEDLDAEDAEFLAALARQLIARRRTRRGADETCTKEMVKGG